MPPSHQVLKLLNSISRRIINSSPSHSLCTLTSSVPKPSPPELPESPDLPPWILNPRNPTDPNPVLDDDDFVIPSLPNWVCPRSTNPQIESNLAPDSVPESNHNEIDKLSQILTQNHSTIYSAVVALNQLSNVNVSEDLVSQVLKRFSNNWVRSLGLFIWAKNQTGYLHTPDLYNFIIDILGKCRRFSLMWELVAEMSKLDGYVTLLTFTKVMRRLAKAGMYNEAVDAFIGMENFGVRKNTEGLNTLMDALVKEGSVQHAHSVFLEFKDYIRYDRRTFNVLVHGYCKLRMVGKAREVMEEMQQCGFSPDVVTYTCFVEAYCRERDFRNVKSMLELMEQKGCKPNVITYTMVMHAFGKARQTSDALEVYEQMKRNGCVPDSSFYSALIFLLSKRGRIKDAYDVFDDMVKQGVRRDLLTYNTTISCACLHSQEERALNLLQQMKEDLCMPDIKTYIPLLRLCFRNKRVKVLKFLLTHMFNSNVSIDRETYGFLVLGLCKNGNLEDACVYYEEAVFKGLTPRRRVYNTLAQKLNESGMFGAKQKIEMLMSKASRHEALSSSDQSSIPYNLRI